MMADNDASSHAPRPHVFILRLWQEDLGNGQTDWRGRVQHVSSGEVRFFRDWPALEAFLEGRLHQNKTGESDHGE
jgi:hypothetical protein